MRIFISSLITGMEDWRRAAKEAISVLGHEPVMAEDFGALPRSPQIACLDGVRRSGAVILILGERYGSKQVSGLSATHEEFREARERCPVLVFVQSGVNPEQDQAAFITEVQGWGSGLMRDSFATPAELKDKVTRALHRMEVASASAPFDPTEVLERALAAFPRDDRHYQRGESLTVAVFGGPSQTVLRPSEMEQPELAEKLEQQALYGSIRIFARGEGTTSEIESDKLVIKQDGREPHFVQLDGQGGIVIRLPLEREPDSHFNVIVVEAVQDYLRQALRYSTWLLDEIDATQRLSHLVVVTSLAGGLGMVTRSELRASPNSLSMPSFGRNEPGPVHLSPAHVARPALSQDMDRIVSDLVTLMRRQRR
jgi:Domain of unknown function (DUF4062)